MSSSDYLDIAISAAHFSLKWFECCRITQLTHFVLHCAGCMSDRITCLLITAKHNTTQPTLALAILQLWTHNRCKYNNKQLTLDCHARCECPNRCHVWARATALSPVSASAHVRALNVRTTPDAASLSHPLSANKFQCSHVRRKHEQSTPCSVSPEQ